MMKTTELRPVEVLMVHLWTMRVNLQTMTMQTVLQKKSSKKMNKKRCPIFYGLLL